jgi:ATP synthase protein I
VKIHKLEGNAAIAKAVCLTQIAIAAVAALVAGVLAGREPAIAALYGGIVAVVPTIYLARHTLTGLEGRKPPEMVGAFYRGEIGKLALTALLFALGVGLFAKQFLALILTYAACLLAYWLVIARVVYQTGDSD